LKQLLLLLLIIISSSRVIPALEDCSRHQAPESHRLLLVPTNPTDEDRTAAAKPSFLLLLLPNPKTLHLLPLNPKTLFCFCLC
jgi:hypothetical protein